MGTNGLFSTCIGLPLISILSNGPYASTAFGFSSNDFRQLDGNRDRRLSNKELVAAGASAIVGRYESTMSVVHGLSEIDTDGDRFATREELNAVYQGLGDNEFREVDVNRDNRISATEL